MTLKYDTETNHDVDFIEEVSHDDSSIPDRVEEIGGREGPEPTRFGDWEKKGRCIDF